MKAYLHKTCDLKELDGRDALMIGRRGIYFYGLLGVVCSISGEGKDAQIIPTPNPEEFPVPDITEIRCHDCGESIMTVNLYAQTLESRIGHDPQSYGLVYSECRILD